LKELQPQLVLIAYILNKHKNYFGLPWRITKINHVLNLECAKAAIRFLESPRLQPQEDDYFRYFAIWKQNTVVSVCDNE